jgi:DUF971 family protein
MEPRLELDPARGVLIEWADGHQSSYRPELLRRLCPCAVCRQGRGADDRLPVLSTLSPEATRLDRLELAGNYGVTLVWGDGHSTGIYSWETLRKHCDCLACRLAEERGTR